MDLPEQEELGDNQAQDQESDRPFNNVFLAACTAAPAQPGPPRLGDIFQVRREQANTCLRRPFCVVAGVSMVSKETSQATPEISQEEILRRRLDNSGTRNRALPSVEGEGGTVPLSRTENPT